jgi:hexokinase
VCEVTLQGQHTFTMRHDKYKVSDALKTGPATELFDFIAQCVEGFISTLGTQDKKESNEPLYLGFTFSFPVQQTALDKGTLISWTKVSFFRFECGLSAWHVFLLESEKTDFEKSMIHLLSGLDLFWRSRQ